MNGAGVVPVGGDCGDGCGPTGGVAGVPGEGVLGEGVVGVVPGWVPGCGVVGGVIGVVPGVVPGAGVVGVVGAGVGVLSEPTGGVAGVPGGGVLGCGETSEPIGGLRSEPGVCPGVMSEPMPC